MPPFTRRFSYTAPTANANPLKELVTVQQIFYRKPKQKSFSKVVQKAFWCDSF